MRTPCIDVTPPPATPLAALALGALYTTLDGASVEREVRASLRHGTRDGVLCCADGRAVVASAVFGVSALRARLAYMLSACAPEPIEPRDRTSGERRREAARRLLALFLLHETPRRTPPGAMERLLPPTSLGLTGPALQRLRALKPGAMAWPTKVPGLAARHSIPMELARSWAAQLGVAGAEALCASANEPGPVTLRVNQRVTSRDALVGHLDAAGLRCRAGLLSPFAVHLPQGGRAAYGGSVWSLAGWVNGAFEVQDEGSQCVALACDAVEGDRVLDWCAGNGGKSLALAAQVGPRGHVLCHDVVQSRLQALLASAERARVSGVVSTVCTDGADGGDGDALERASRRLAPSGFDLVLVDAPCSSSGTLRRHPDLRWRGDWGGAASAELAAQQLALLTRAAAHVGPGGRLVYATCALDPRENGEVADAFERACAEERLELSPWPLAEGAAGRHEGPRERHRATLWPHVHGTDGFFIARWRVGRPVSGAGSAHK